MFFQEIKKRHFLISFSFFLIFLFSFYFQGSLLILFSFEKMPGWINRFIASTFFILPLDKTPGLCYTIIRKREGKPEQTRKEEKKWSFTAWSSLKWWPTSLKIIRNGWTSKPTWRPIPTVTKPWGLKKILDKPDRACYNVITKKKRR